MPKLGLKNPKSVLYALYKQQYLEWIEGGDHLRNQVGNDIADMHVRCEARVVV